MTQVLRRLQIVACLVCQGERRVVHQDARFAGIAYRLYVLRRILVFNDFRVWSSQVCAGMFFPRLPTAGVPRVVDLRVGFGRAFLACGLRRAAVKTCKEVVYRQLLYLHPNDRCEIGTNALSSCIRFLRTFDRVADVAVSSADLYVVRVRLARAGGERQVSRKERIIQLANDQSQVGPFLVRVAN